MSNEDERNINDSKPLINMFWTSFARQTFHSLRDIGCQIWDIWSSLQKCSIKKGVLKNIAKFTGNFIKKETMSQEFSREFCEIFRNTFFSQNFLHRFCLFCLVLRRWIPKPGVPCSKPQGGSQFNSACHPSKVDQMSTRNFSDLSDKK